MFKHIVGPHYGGLNTNYDSIPYYPIRVREKMQKGEVQPSGQLTKSEALNLLITREAHNPISHSINI